MPLWKLRFCATTALKIRMFSTALVGHRDSSPWIGSASFCKCVLIDWFAKTVIMNVAPSFELVCILNLVWFWFSRLHYGRGENGEFSILLKNRLYVPNEKACFSGSGSESSHGVEGKLEVFPLNSWNIIKFQPLNLAVTFWNVQGPQWKTWSDLWHCFSWLPAHSGSQCCAPPFGVLVCLLWNCLCQLISTSKFIWWSQEVLFLSKLQYRWSGGVDSSPFLSGPMLSFS